jgi:hypothetical protein
MPTGIFARTSIFPYLNENLSFVKSLADVYELPLKLSFFAIIIAVFTFAQSAPSYYSGIDFRKTKNDLKTDLATLITDTHTQTISYSAGLANLFQTSDVDPDNSSNILLIYGSEASGTHQRSRPYSATWNREHVYAKSKGTILNLMPRNQIISVLFRS